MSSWLESVVWLKLSGLPKNLHGVRSLSLFYQRPSFNFQDFSFFPFFLPRKQGRVSRSVLNNPFGSLKHNYSPSKAYNGSETTKRRWKINV